MLPWHILAQAELGGRRGREFLDGPESDGLPMNHVSWFSRCFLGEVSLVSSARIQLGIQDP